MRSKKRLHLGPVMPGWGSWEWLGQAMMPVFQEHGDVEAFRYEEEPPADGLIVIIKHPPPTHWWQTIQARRLPVIYAPVDYYDSTNAIDADAAWLSELRHIIIHCHRLQGCFAPYAPVTYIDHQLRFFTDQLVMPRANGPILWVGVHSNLPPLVEWLHSNRLSKPLHVLTNLDQADPRELGFPKEQIVTIEKWSPARHLGMLAKASAAIDVKGDDFRSRHKPPTKALDYLASGLPLAMPACSSVSEHLLGLDFKLADANDDELWFSHEYLRQCHTSGKAIRGTHSPQKIAEHWWSLLSVYF